MSMYFRMRQDIQKSRDNLAASYTVLCITKTSVNHYSLTVIVNTGAPTIVASTVKI